MPTLLDLPEVRSRAYPITVADYHRLQEDVSTELLRGVVIRRERKTPLHCYIASELRDLFDRHVPPGCVVFQYSPLTFADSEPEPDVSIMAGTEKDFEHRHPSTAELVVEVSMTCLEIDRLKIPIYVEAGVKEYWIVRPETKAVEVYRQPTPTGYAEKLTVTAPAVLQPVALPGVTVDLAELFG